MRRWPEIVLTLVLFAAVMAALSWVVNATVPAFADWVWDRIGGAAAWAILIVVIVSAGAFGIYDYRRTGRNPNGT